MAHILTTPACHLATKGISCLRTPITTALAVIAFAANSIICRMALGRGAIDPTSFTTIRLVSGALVLMVIAAMVRKQGRDRHPGNWLSALVLFGYAATFSYAYVSLTTGTGALILFGTVQATILTAGVISGERPPLLAWCGIAIAMLGLVYLVLPGLAAPPLAGAALMVIAGISWGIYSIRGRDQKNPAAVTSDNFLRSAPIALGLSLALIYYMDISYQGALLAITSGALTSGVGYVLWYAALRNLTATMAASVQLLAPMLAASGGVLLMSEPITLRLVIASILMIGGVGTTIAFKIDKTKHKLPTTKH